MFVNRKSAVPIACVMFGGLLAAGLSQIVNFRSCNARIVRLPFLTEGQYAFQSADSEPFHGLPDDGGRTLTENKTGFFEGDLFVDQNGVSAFFVDVNDKVQGRPGYMHVNEEGKISGCNWPRK